MHAQITLPLSERVVRQAKHVATKRQQPLEEVLSGWLENVITEMPVEELPDEEVLALTQLQLTPQQETSLSSLLAKNRENELDAEGRGQLHDLMRVYERGLLRKAQALRVAVQRGLREPLAP